MIKLNIVKPFLITTLEYDKVNWVRYKIFQKKIRYVTWGCVNGVVASGKIESMAQEHSTNLGFKPITLNLGPNSTPLSPWEKPIKVPVVIISPANMW